jgi:RNA polymerase sigma-70 factor (ECF subfamily)
MTMALPMEVEADKPVVEAARVGDRVAFEQLVRTHRRWVNSVIFGVLGDRSRVEDVAQHVWKTVWKRIADLRDSEQWQSWLYSTARNAAVDAGRKITRHRKLVEQAAAAPPVHPESSPELSLAEQERQRTIMNAIRSLPGLYREPFVLRHVQGWSYKQIGDTMGMPVATVETRLVRARQMLRAALQGKV